MRSKVVELVYLELVRSGSAIKEEVEPLSLTWQNGTKKLSKVFTNDRKVEKRDEKIERQERNPVALTVLFSFTMKRLFHRLFGALWFKFNNYFYVFFFFLQAQLEAEIENLSWKIERAETTDLGDLENQMDIAEKRRTTLLKDFFPVEA